MHLWLPHALKMLRDEEPHNWGARECHVAKHAGMFLLDTRHFREALVLLEQLAALARHHATEDDPEPFNNRRLLAYACHHDRQNTRSIELLEPLVEEQRLSLPPDHDDLVSSEQQLAHVYTHQGLAAKAIPLLSRHFELHERTLPEDAPKRLETQHALGTALLYSGRRLNKAIDLLEDACRRSPSHRRRDWAGQLAWAYMNIGQAEKAVPLFTLMLDESKRVCCGRQLDVQGWTQYGLAMARLRSGQPNESLRLLIDLETVVKENFCRD